MIEVARRKPQTGMQVIRLEIRHFIKDLGGRQARREEVENIAHAHTHPPHARPAPTLLGVYRDSISNLVHTKSIAAASSALHDLKAGQATTESLTPCSSPSVRRFTGPAPSA